MPSRKMIQALTSDTVRMGESSTCSVWERRPRYTLKVWETFCLQTLRPKCINRGWHSNKSEQFSDACDNFCLTISTKKLKSCSNRHQTALTLSPTSTSNQRLHPVGKFTYLSFTLSRNVHIDDDVNSRIAKASSAFWPPKQNSMGPSWHYQSNKA